MPSLKLGAVLSLSPGLKGGDLSALALARLEQDYYSGPNFTGNLGPGNDRWSPNTEDASFWNRGQILAPSNSVMYMVLYGGYEASSSDGVESSGLYFDDQKSVTLYSLSAGIDSKWNLKQIYTKTYQAEKLIPRTYSINGGDLSYQEAGESYWGYREYFSQVVCNNIAQGQPGSVLRIYEDWSTAAYNDDHGDVLVRYIDANDPLGTIKEDNIYTKMMTLGGYKQRGRVTDKTEGFTYHEENVSYWINDIRSDSGYIYYFVEQFIGNWWANEDVKNGGSYSPGESTWSPISAYEKTNIVFKESLSSGDFSFTGQLSIPSLNNDYNWTYIGEAGDKFTNFANGVLALTEVNVRNPEDVPKDSFALYDKYLTYFDNSSNTALYFDIEDVIAPGTLQSTSNGVFTQDWENYQIYTIGEQTFLLRTYQESFKDGNEKLKYDIFAVYLDNSSGSQQLKVSSEAIKSLTFSYAEMGLTLDRYRALGEAVAQGNIEVIEFGGSKLSSLALIDKTGGTDTVKTAFKAYLKFQKDVKLAIASSVEGKSNQDLYIVDNSNISIREVYGKGTKDQVQADCDFTLDDTIEILTLTGADSIDGTGNGKKNLIYGNSQNNVLDGLGGNDILMGGGGDDTLKGGIGNDTLNGENGWDIANYAGVASAISLTLGANGSGTAKGGIDIGSDTLRNIEEVVLGSGGDLVKMGVGRDVITGGNGADTYTYSTLNRGGLYLNPTPGNEERVVDWIKDFAFGIDIIKLPSGVRKSTTQVLNMGTVDGIISAGTLQSLWTFNSFSAKGAAVFQQTQGSNMRSFLAVNNNSAAYDAGDLVVELTGYSTDSGLSFADSVQKYWGNSII